MWSSLAATESKNSTFFFFFVWFSFVLVDTNVPEGWKIRILLRKTGDWVWGEQLTVFSTETNVCHHALNVVGSQYWQMSGYMQWLVHSNKICGSLHKSASMYTYMQNTYLNVQLRCGEYAWINLNFHFFQWPDDFGCIPAPLLYVTLYEEGISAIPRRNGQLVR